MWKSILRLGAIVGVGIVTAVVVDLIVPDVDNGDDCKELEDGKEDDVVDVTPES